MRFIEMKKINFTIKIVLLLTFAFIASQGIKAQTAYGLSDIIYDKATGQVTSYSGTYLDYRARVHYDPAVCGTMFEETTRLGGQCYTGYNTYYDLPQERVYGSTVGLRTTFPSPANTEFDVISNHYVVAYFYTTVIILDDPPGGPPVRRYYDPLSLNQQGGQNLGSYSYQGTLDYSYSQLYEYQYFYLGSTGRAVIANPTSCEDPASGNALAPSCTVPPLKVEIRNEFRGNEDLSTSNTAKNALLGAPVEFSAVVGGGNGGSISYYWLKDDNAITSNPVAGCGTTDTRCSTYFDDKKTSTIKLLVTQTGSQAATKVVSVNGILPTFMEDTSPPYPVIGGFSGIERVPRVTFGNGDCAYQGVRLMLGCTDANPDANPVKPVTSNTKNIAGIYLKAIVVQPTNLISKGDQSAVEISQIAKGSRTRTGTTASGKDFTDRGDYAFNPNSWRLDFQGGGNFNSANIYFSNFKNVVSNNDNINLSYPDSPSDPLLNQTENGESLKEYSTSQEFKTYVTYFNKATIGGSPYMRYALKVVPWSWSARARKNALTNKWSLYGSYSPSQNTSLTSTNINFVKGSSGEETPYGKFLDPIVWNRLVAATSPLTITTKRNVAVWRKNNGVWYIMKPDGTIQVATQWGVDYDIPVPGDYDGDGQADFAVYRPDNPATPENECQNGCTWYILRSSDNNWQTYNLGLQGDIVAPADYDGDGKTDAGVFTPSAGVWTSVKSSDYSIYTKQFGNSGDMPVPSDYDGDGIDDLALWSSYNSTWHIFNSATQTYTTQIWGLSSDKPVIGDYDGDGKTDIANWQPDGNWHILLSSSGQTKDVNFGIPSTDKPIPGDYDGDGKTDIAVWRPNGTQQAIWYILNSSNNQIQYQYWGIDGDIPIPAAYRR